ncbi:hypothetical protein PILCRDRAFT_271284 [Piloderma croceum F 1598]|uniref:Uncharacterized protein n=1 Tax=Piloderma croceum (strain F 1598) TaxID=765440 RepID=A0A0C3BLG5_PILCF|nr:hypothetical protein PILCRDRAFT_271284 [Piloderma croceum F 1598]
MCQFPIIYLFVIIINTISFDIERDLIINPTSEGTSARTAPAPTGNSSATGERQGEANIPTPRPHEQTRQAGEMTSSAMNELQRALSGGYQGLTFPSRPPLSASNMGLEFFAQLHGTGGLPPMFSAYASNFGQDTNIDQGNALPSEIPPDYWGGAAGPSSSGPQTYEAFDAESMILQQEIERLEAEVARSRSRLENFYPNLPFGTSGPALAEQTYVGKGKGRAV